MKAVAAAAGCFMLRREDLDGATEWAFDPESSSDDDEEEEEEEEAASTWPMASPVGLEGRGCPGEGQQQGGGVEDSASLRASRMANTLMIYDAHVVLAHETVG